MPLLYRPAERMLAEPDPDALLLPLRCAEEILQREPSQAEAAWIKKLFQRLSFVELLQSERLWQNLLAAFRSSSHSGGLPVRDRVENISSLRAHGQQSSIFLVGTIVPVGDRFVFRDGNTEIDCVVLSPDFQLARDNFVLLSKWLFIPKAAGAAREHLEVSELYVVAASELKDADALAAEYNPLSVEEAHALFARDSRLEADDSTAERAPKRRRTAEPVRRLSLAAKLTALSPLVTSGSNEENSFFMMELTSSENKAPAMVTHVLFRGVSGLRWYPFLRVRGTYLFTALTNSTIMPGKRGERRVLTNTDSTEVFDYRCAIAACLQRAWVVCS
eukprot:TRINITY_DN10911_c0_g1_i1.p1 TRINITY_DN10911_c0_g1~~TRINITY_DN10911_c0_g1_i1.p1  ORF type:complete len:332 (+),score=55.61 TRINITY_DN10911_c0_g1_i1:99-1094(+)